MQARTNPVPAPPDDPLEKLVGRMAAGQEGALGELYDATSPRVFGLTLRILGDRAAAEEATIDVYTQVWKQTGRYDPAKGTVLAWLLILGRSRAIDILRSRARRAEQESSFAASLDLSDPAPGPEQASSEAERARRVRLALRSLPGEQRAALEVVYFGGLSHREAAEALSQPLGTVKTRVRTGLATLHRALTPPPEGLA